MTIQPVNFKVQLKIDKPTAGVLDLTSKETATEFGEVIAIGDEVSSVMIGDKIFFKAWALDVIAYQGENYFFIDSNSEGICAIIK
jgi:co-chaperonin GroES (HSP10)